MRCPFCGNEETLVKDSRICDNGEGIRRKRVCPNCDAKFTTIEKILRREVIVVKKDGRRVLFDKDKLNRSVTLCAGKSLDGEQIAKIVQDISKRIENNVATEIKSSQIGEMVLDCLERIDKVAFIRFASVYANFETPDDFDKFIKKIVNLDPRTEN